MAEQKLTDEQRQALQEKLANMSPEELREFQKKQCIFCRIISKEMEGRIVFEDDKVLAVLDVNPAAKGHIVLMSKEHYVISPQIPEEVMGHLFVVAKNLSQILLKAFKAHGTNIYVANGLAAGQKAQHFMIHIIPRKEGDNLLTLPLGEASEEDLSALATAMKPKIAAVFAKAVPEAPKETAKKEAKTIEDEVPKKKKSKKKTAKKKKGGEVSLDDIADLFK